MGRIIADARPCRPGAAYGLDWRDPIPERTEKIQHGIFKSFVPPLALYGLLGLIMHSLRNGRSSQADREVKS